MQSNSTQASLLERVRDPANHAAWREFESKYRDLILRYSRARGLRLVDAEDVLQIGLLSLVKSLPGFEYSPERGRFRHYLGQVVRSAIRRHLGRPNRGAAALSDDVLKVLPGDESSDAVWEEEWVRHHYRVAMGVVRTTFEPRSVAVFDELLAGEPVAEVARRFDLSPQAVHKIKQRIRERLKVLIAAQIREEDEHAPSEAAAARNGR